MSINKLIFSLFFDDYPGNKIYFPTNPDNRESTELLCRCRELSH